MKTPHRACWRGRGVRLGCVCACGGGDGVCVCGGGGGNT